MATWIKKCSIKYCQSASNWDRNHTVIQIGEIYNKELLRLDRRISIKISNESSKSEGKCERIIWNINEMPCGVKKQKCKRQSNNPKVLVKSRRMKKFCINFRFLSVLFLNILFQNNYNVIIK